MCEHLYEGKRGILPHLSCILFSSAALHHRLNRFRSVLNVVVASCSCSRGGVARPAVKMRAYRVGFEEKIGYNEARIE